MGGWAGEDTGAKATEMKLNQFSFNLAQKGFLLVGLPLAFEIVFVTILAALLHQADLTTLRERHLTDILLETGLLKRKFDECSVLLIGGKLSLFSQEEEEGKSYEVVRRQLAEQLKLVSELASDTPNQKELLQQINEYFTQSLESLDRLKKKLDENGNVPNLVLIREIKTELAAHWRRSHPLMTQLDRSLNDELQKIGPESEVTTRSRIQIILAGGVILNILLAISLVAYFNRGTASRLKTIMDNTVKLAKQEALNPPLAGTDELAHLDQTFHNMAMDLAEAIGKERAVVENALDVICSIGEEGNFSSVNPASLRVWGYNPDELLGKHYSEILDSQSAATTLQAVQDIINNKSLGAFESKIKRKDGTTADILWSMYWSAAHKSMFCVAHDITDRKEIERLKQDFVAMLSHDLRSPLTAVQGALSLTTAGVDGQLPDKVIQRLNKSQQNVQRIITIVNDLLDIEKMNAGMMQLNKTNVALIDIFEHARDNVEVLAQQKELKLVITNTNIDIIADMDLVQRVLVNLISNAIKYSPPNGEITITATETGDFVEVCVTDEGPGVPEAYKEAIFDRYRQVDGASRAGTGLGLAICKAVIEEHGGTIGVRSEPGKGSTFWFRLPS
jgi:PAS domain S-box-containing protein